MSVSAVRTEQLFLHFIPRGIWVMYHGGDRGKLIKPFLERGMRFIVRLVGNRNLLARGREVLAEMLAEECQLPYAETILKEDHGREKCYHLEFGFRPVKLPGREESMFLVVVKRFGKEPLMLLTNLPMRKNREVLWQAVSGYLSRLLVEETIRFIKQSYNLEDLRVLDYDRLKNMAALVLVAAFFTAVRLGRGSQIGCPFPPCHTPGKRFYMMPGFHYYALADGSPLAGFMRKRPSHISLPSAPPDPQLFLFPIGP